MINNAVLEYCPFGIDARFCEHQETRAKDVFSAMQGELVFICKIGTEKCPKMKELFGKVLNEEE